MLVLGQGLSLSEKVVSCSFAKDETVIAGS
jgi:hypothetical protein